MCCRYGDLAARNVRGVVLEAFGVGNMPDLPSQGYLPWLKRCIKQGIKVRGVPPCRTLKSTMLAVFRCVHGTQRACGRMRPT